MATQRQPIEPHGSSQGDERKVIPFRPRASQQATKSPSQKSIQAPILPEDLSSYERDREVDDYRHRMIMNVAAGVATMALTAFGIWLAMSIADLRKTTDCILVGRSDCTSIPAHHR